MARCQDILVYLIITRPAFEVNQFVLYRHCTYSWFAFTNSRDLNAYIDQYGMRLVYFGNHPRLAKGGLSRASGRLSKR